MEERVVFYRLSKKFVSNQDKIPEDAQQIVYYSLAIGHHVGVMDCFDNLMEIPLTQYQSWISKLQTGEGRRKMEGLLKWGEIEINASHVGELLPLFNKSLSEMEEHEKNWALIFIQALSLMKSEPAFYLMIRR